METTWRARPVLTARVAFAFLIALLALALAAGTIVVGGQLLRTTGPNGLSTLPAAALFPTACPSGTQLHSGDIATIAGTGYALSPSDGGVAAAATAVRPAFGVAVGADGAITFSEGAFHLVRRIDTDGTLTTITGTGGLGDSGDGGPATSAILNFPGGLAFDLAGNLYIPDLQAGKIRKVDPNGIISTVAGTGVAGSSGNGGPAIEAQVSADQVATGPDGSLYFDDNANFRTIGPDGIIRAFAGTGVQGFSGDGGPAVDATFAEVNGAVADDQGNVYLGDSDNHRIRIVDAAGIITTYAGTGTSGITGDGGPALAATFDYPGALARDPAGNLYIADPESHVVRKIDPTGIVSTIAGDGVPGSSGDCGPAAAARLSHPTGVAVHDGVLYITDTDNYRIRMVVP